MDRIEAMTTVIQVVDAGSFSAAAHALRTPLSTVSRRVSELEARLGVRLLTRTTRKVSLTEAGQTYVASARRILEAIEESERLAAGEFQTPRGELALTAPILFGRLHLLPIVADFLAEYPAIQVRMLMSDRNLHLLDEHVDMGVRIGALPDSRMVATRVGRMRTVVCASPEWIARHGAPLTPDALTRCPIVAFDPMTSGATWAFRGRDMVRFETPIRPRLSVSTAEAALWAAVRGVGATRLLHYQCAEAVREGALQILLSDFELEPAPVHLIHAGLGALPLKMRVFLDFASGRLRERLAALANP